MIEYLLVNQQRRSTLFICCRKYGDSEKINKSQQEYYIQLIFNYLNQIQLLHRSFLFFSPFYPFFSRVGISWFGYFWENINKLTFFNVISTFTLFVYSLTYFITIWYSLQYSIKFRKIDIFLPCITLSCIEIILAIYFTGINNDYNQFAEFSQYYHTVYIAIESFIIAVFYFNLNTTKRIKHIISYVIIAIFLLLCIAVILEFCSLYLGLVIFEFFLVNVNALSIYFIAIKSNKFEIRNDELIISNGLFIFINFTAPYFIVDQSVEDYNYILNSLKFINSLGYCIFCFTNILSIKWKIKNLQIS